MSKVRVLCTPTPRSGGDPGGVQKEGHPPHRAVHWDGASCVSSGNPQPPTRPCAHPPPGFETMEHRHHQHFLVQPTASVPQTLCHTRAPDFGSLIPQRRVCPHLRPSCALLRGCGDAHPRCWIAKPLPCTPSTLLGSSPAAAAPQTRVRHLLPRPPLWGAYRNAHIRGRCGRLGHCTRHTAVDPAAV